MTNFLLVVLHSTFFDYISYLNNGHKEIPVQLLQNNSNLKPVSIDKNYKIRYLLGDMNFEGIIKKYLSKVQNIGIVEEEYFKSHFDDLLSTHDQFDFQFSGNIPYSFIKTITMKNKLFHGWAYPQLGGKHIQVQQLSKISCFKSYLPLQLNFFDLRSLQDYDPKIVSDYFPSELLIVKSFYSSKSKMNDGTGYPIFKKKNWKEFIIYATQHPVWFEGKHGIIISEFIEIECTETQISNASIHKIHLPTFLDTELANWNLGCQIIKAQFHLNRVSNKIRQIEEVYELLNYSIGNLNDYKAIFKKFCKYFFPFPCLFGVDLMITVDGTRTLDVEGVQFHPESFMTKRGLDIIRNFISNENRRVV